MGRERTGEHPWIQHAERLIASGREDELVDKAHEVGEDRLESPTDFYLQKVAHRLCELGERPHQDELLRVK